MAHLHLSFSIKAALKGVGFSMIAAMKLRRFVIVFLLLANRKNN